MTCLKGDSAKVHLHMQWGGSYAGGLSGVEWSGVGFYWPNPVAGLSLVGSRWVGPSWVRWDGIGWRGVAHMSTPQCKRARQHAAVPNVPAVAAVPVCCRWW
jgi:hypothetical protein